MTHFVSALLDLHQYVNFVQTILTYNLLVNLSTDLWCGASWNNVLEDCPKACPEGTDEECGEGMICYDLSESELICRTPGIGVKEKGDPQKRWCGADYNDMLSSCPKRCPSGSDDECPLGRLQQEIRYLSSQAHSHLLTNKYLFRNELL